MATGLEEVELPVTEVEAEVMVLKVMEVESLRLHNITRFCVRVSIVLSTSAGAAPTRTNEKPTYLLLWHFHPVLV